MVYDDMFFNINHGYLEGLVRGFKGGILSQTDYSNLVQCETLEGAILYIVLLQLWIVNHHNLDLKLHLQSTDYGNFLANEPGPISVNVIEERLKEKLVLEFNHFRNHSLEPLSTFLDYITLDRTVEIIEMC